MSFFFFINSIYSSLGRNKNKLRLPFLSTAAKALNSSLPYELERVFYEVVFTDLQNFTSIVNFQVKSFD